jgi:UDP-3-O-[3-hydroxymyristoyl] glucosamine N-acyltransferase
VIGALPSATRTRGLSAAEVANLVGGRLEGEPEARVVGVGDFARVGETDAAVVFDLRNVEAARASAAGVLIDASGADFGRRTVVRVENPRAALAVLLDRFYPESRRPPGVDPRAFVSPAALLHPTVHVAAGAHVEAGARLDEGVEVHAGAVVGEGCLVGAGTILHPRVVLYAGTRVGARVEIHAGAVVGSPGFGFVRDAAGRQQRIPQIGWVEIEDDVEIGALTAIDRATLGATRIGRGAKIDNLVQIGHNSVIGEDSCIAAQVGISGSVEVGARSLLLGQVGVADHSTLAPESVIAAQSGVVGRVGPGEWFGYPAISAPRARRVYTLIARLPELFREVRKLRAAVQERAPAKPGVEPGREPGGSE